MKISFISDQYFPRTSADSEQIISSLSALGKIHEVTFLSAKIFFKKKPSKDDLSNYYLKEITFDLDFIRAYVPVLRGIEKSIFAIKTLFYLKRKKPELVYTRNLPIVFVVLLFTSIPVMLEAYRPWPERNLQAKWFFKKLVKASNFLGVILHSDFAKKSFLKVGFKENDLLVAHNAFDLNEYESENKSTDSTRRKFNIPANTKLITYSGRVSKKKAVDKLLILAKEFPEHTFLIVGSEKQGEIEKQASQISNVIVLGWMNKAEVFEILRASDVLYIPPSLKARDVSLNTVLPLKTFIYKASGTAIFGPSSEDIKEVLVHKKNAFLVQPDVFEAELNGFKELIDNDLLRKKIGEKAKEEMELLTWDKRATLINNFLEQRLSEIQQ